MRLVSTRPWILRFLVPLGLCVLASGGVASADEPEAAKYEVPERLARASHEALADDSMRALLLAREAFERRPDVTTRSALYSALARTYEHALLRGHEGPLTSVDVTADRLVTGSQDGTARVWTFTGELIARHDAGRPVRDVSFRWGRGDLLTVSDAESADRVDLLLWSEGEPRVLAEGIGADAYLLSPIRDHLLIRTAPGRWRLEGDGTTEIQAASVAFGPRGKRCIVTRGEGAIALLDLATRRETALGDVPGATTVVFHPAGDRLLVHGAGSTAWMLDCEGTRLAVLEHEGPIERAGFSARDGSLVVATRGAFVHWNPGGERLGTMPKAGPVRAMAFADEAGTLVTATGEDTLTVFTLNDGAAVATSHVGAPVRAIEVHPKGTWIKARLEGGGVTCYDVDLGVQHPLGDPSRAVTYSQLGPFGRYDVNADAKGKVVLVDFVRQRPVHLLGHTEGLVDAVVTQDGYVATASADGTARLWKLHQDGTPTLGGHPHYVYGGAFLETGERIVTMSWNESFLWYLDGRRTAHRTFRDPPRWWAFGPRAFAVAPKEGGAVLVFGAGGEDPMRLDHGATVAGVAWLPNGERLLSWSSEGRTVRVYGRQGTLLGTARRADPILRAVFQSRDTVATLGPADTVRLTTVPGVRKGEWALPEPAGSLTRAGDGRHLFTVAEDGSTARLFDEAGTQVLVIDDHEDAILSVDLTPRPRRRVLSGSEDGTAVLRDLDGTVLATLEHPAAVTSVSFFPDDERFATACEDGALRIYSKDGALWAVLHGHAAGLTGFHFTRRGDRVLTLSKDYTARLWPGTDKALRKTAEARCRRELTPEERGRYEVLLGR